MKTVINESKLNSIIYESIKKHINEMFDTDMFNGGMQEAESETDNKKDDDKGDSKNKRSQVISALNKDGVDCSQYAYKLWPNKQEDSARGYFFKCLHGEKNDNGYTYEFDDAEINRLYQMLTSDAI